MTNNEIELKALVPLSINVSEILRMLHTIDIEWKYVNAIKTHTNVNDDVLCQWLNISVQSFGRFKKSGSMLKENAKERALLVLSLIRRGTEVFGSAELFTDWLSRENFIFDKRTPIVYRYSGRNQIY
jgi:uncharacterized protein (DUF2384 family)